MWSKPREKSLPPFRLHQLVIFCESQIFKQIRKMEGFVFIQHESVLFTMPFWKLTQLSSKHLYGSIWRFFYFKGHISWAFSKLWEPKLPKLKVGISSCWEKTVFSSIMLLRKKTNRLGSACWLPGDQHRRQHPGAKLQPIWKKGIHVFHHLLGGFPNARQPYFGAKKKTWWLELEDTRKQRGYVFFRPAMVFNGH